jgi:hypothetical protein
MMYYIYMNNILIIDLLDFDFNIKQYNTFLSKHNSYDVIIIKNYWLGDNNNQLLLPSNLKLCIIKLKGNTEINNIKHKFLVPDTCIFEELNTNYPIFTKKFMCFSLDTLLKNYNVNEINITFAKFEWYEIFNKCKIKLVLPVNKEDYIKVIDNKPHILYNSPF